MPSGLDGELQGKPGKLRAGMKELHVMAKCAHQCCVGALLAN